MTVFENDDLMQLVNKINKCNECIVKPKGSKLPHLPKPVLRVSKSAKLCICGQAPGTRVHKSGIPFTDPSGDRLRSWLGLAPELFYDTEKVSIIPMGFCFPGLDEKGADLPPRKECAPLWRDRLFNLLPNIKLILLVGHYAQKWHLREKCKKNLTETVRAWKEYKNANQGVEYIPLPHPSWRNNAWLMKNNWFEEEIIPYLRARIRKLLCF